ncbi:putative phosphatidylinositol N-acetylglucosaminyltransferase subunit P [Paratrimastix pyriformis]|uniref:Phosphatidylinositol N-acetylglucosaminyltransferase subunit P n=1 Tax=Paratrimastix pyriformis TaxID=342808 RepID=A0ABQ8UVL8_9EUKA|nr:putative phosphatidylinositol N-acetylglucosaminyltransferase subunit P [Paratrimastix pyriformis]
MPDDRFQDTQEPSETAVYGFVCWITGYIIYSVFLVWAFLPDSVLRYIGWTYYPQKYWALAIPAYVIVLVVFIELIYLAYNMMKTNPLDSPLAITDRASRFPSEQEREILHRNPGSIPPAWDIPIGAVNQIVFRSGRWAEQGVPASQRACFFGKKASLSEPEFDRVWTGDTRCRSENSDHPERFLPLPPPAHSDQLEETRARDGPLLDVPPRGYIDSGGAAAIIRPF